MNNLDYFNAIKEYLIKKGWDFLKASSKEYFEFIAPDNLNFSEKESLIILNKFYSKTSERYLREMMEVASSYHNESADQVKQFLKFNQNFFSLRIYDEKIINNSISLNRANNLISFLKKFILNTAEFSVNPDVIFDEHLSKEALTYLDACRIPAFESGSFICKVELPRETDLKTFKQQSFFEDLNFNVNIVIDNIFEMIDLPIGKILTNRELEINDKLVYENEKNINLNILQNIKDLYSLSNIKNVDFTINSNDSNKTIISENIEEFDVKRLEFFIQKAENLLIENVHIDLPGRVRGLHSKDLLNNNKIEIYHLDPETGKTDKIECILDNFNYKKALKAHEHQQNVNIKGLAKKMKTKYKVIELEEFEIIQ